MKPLAIDLFCGLGGWTEGLLAEGYFVVGFDIEQHVYGEHRYPAQLVLQDVLTIHGRQFKDASLIVASPPCQEYSYMAMPWSIAKQRAAEYRSGARDVKNLTALFDSCFRIQSEASGAANRHIPLVVENVRGACPWVGRSRWNYGSFHFWGDVPALMPMVRKHVKVDGFRFDGSGKSFQTAAVDGVKNPGLNWSKHGTLGYAEGPGRCFRDSAIKNTGGSWFGVAHSTIKGNNPDGRKRNDPRDGFKGVPHRPTGHWAKSQMRHHGSKSSKRKMASAMIAKIPETVSRHIAKVYYPRETA